MRTTAPFKQDDLDDLEQLLEQATAVVPMRDVFAGVTDPRIIGMRHDVDNDIEPAVWMAAWEAGRGYRSTYYILHSAPYWQDKDVLQGSLEVIAGFGHEIGIHNAVLSEAVRTQHGVDPHRMLSQAIEELEGYGHDISGTVAHGAAECYDKGGRVQLVNDEIFSECARPGLGAPDRTVAGVKIAPKSLEVHCLEYDANWLKRGAYISDSGGNWSVPGFERIAGLFPYPGQLHMLVHPDWWGEAFMGGEGYEGLRADLAVNQ